MHYYTCTPGDSLVRLSSVSLMFLILKWNDASDDEWILNDALSSYIARIYNFFYNDDELQ